MHVVLTRLAGCALLVTGVGVLGCGTPSNAPPAPQVDAGAPPLRDASPDTSNLPPPLEGVRWTNIEWVKPANLASISNVALPDYLEQGAIVVLLALDDSAPAVTLRAGTGRLTEGDGGPGDGYLFEDEMGPSPVPVVLRDRAFTLGGPGVTWSVSYFYGGVLPLPIRQVELSGMLDDEGHPTSPGLTGRYAGCFTQTDWRTLAEEACGSFILTECPAFIDSHMEALGDPDVACGGSGDLDGYAFEVRWEALEVVELHASGEAPSPTP